MMLSFRILSLVVLLAPASASATEITLAEGFTPNPMELQVELKVASPRMYAFEGATLPEKDLGQLGFINCGGTNTTIERPAVVFHLPKPMRDLRMLLVDVPSDHPLVLVMPDRRYQCVSKTIYSNSWPAGRYAIYVTTDNAMLTRRSITFDQPERARAELFARFAKLPTLSSEATERANPSYLQVPITPAVPGRTVGIGPEHAFLTPLATIDVVKPGNYTLRNGGGLLILDEREATIPTSSINDRWEHPFYKLAAGRYRVFGVTGDRAKPPAGSLAFASDTAPLRFADVAPAALAASGPTVLDVRTATEGDLWRKGACARLGRAPSLIITVGEDYVLGTFRTAPNTRVSWDVYRLDGAPYQDMTCDVTGGVRLPRGTYAVWAHAGTAGTPLAVLARPARETPDPTYRPFEVAAGLPIARRTILWHYPFHGSTVTDNDSKRTTLAAPAEPLFLTAPDGMFVSTNRTQGAVVAGEPLLVVTTAADRIDGGDPTIVEVARYDGVVHQVAADSLVDTLPRPATLPKKPELVVAKTVSEAYGILGAAEKPLRDALQARYDDFHGCVGGWMAKNDPTWGKSYELVNLRTGRTVSDEKFKVANRVCGESKLLAAEKKFVAGVNASRKKSALAYLASLKKRFQ